MGRDSETKPNGAFKPHGKGYQLVFEGRRLDDNTRSEYRGTRRYGDSGRFYRSEEGAVL